MHFAKFFFLKANYPAADKFIAITAKNIFCSSVSAGFFVTLS